MQDDREKIQRRQGLLRSRVNSFFLFFMEDCEHDSGNYVDQNKIMRCSICDKPVNDHTLDKYNHYRA